MIKFLSIALIVTLCIHGLIHLMGFVAYWPLGKISELPYKTTLLGGRWEIGPTGVRVLSLLWLLAAAGFVTAALGLIFGRSWWAWLLLGSALLSAVVCILDWNVAFRGAWIDAAILLVLAVFLGLRVQPQPFPMYAAPTATVETVPLPAGLPAPVERFYRQRYGDSIPVYQSAVISGRGPIRLMGITFPGRLRFSHTAGESYRHYIEATIFGQPVIKANEWYLDGHNTLELPFGTTKGDPCADSAANQGLWAESLAYPAILLTDPRVRWEPVDQTRAALYVPYGDTDQLFTIHFDPRSGEISRYETDRCYDSKVGKMRWWGDIRVGERGDGEEPRQTISATWENEGTPWLVFEIESVVFNADLDGYISQKGP